MLSISLKLEGNVTLPVMPIGITIVATLPILREFHQSRNGKYRIIRISRLKSCNINKQTDKTEAFSIDMCGETSHQHHFQTPFPDQHQNSRSAPFLTMHMDCQNGLTILNCRNWKETLKFLPDILLQKLPQV